MEKVMGILPAYFPGGYYMRKMIMLAIVVAFFLTNINCSANTSLKSSELVFTITVDEIKTTAKQIAGLGFNLKSDLGIDLNKAQYDIEVYKFVYDVEYNGKMSQASGVILVPKKEGTLSLASIQHGTRTKTENMPSRITSLFNTFGGRKLNLEGIIEAMIGGFLTVEPDGLGTTVSAEAFGPYYNYHIADAYVASTTAALRATREFAKSKSIELNNKLFLRGYSEGGFATMAVYRGITQNPTLLTEFPLTAVAAGAGAYDLLFTVKELLSDTLTQPVYLPYVYLGYEQRYALPVTLFGKVFTAASDMIRNLFNGLKTTAEINEAQNSAGTKVLSNDPAQILKTAAINCLQTEIESEIDTACADTDIKKFRTQLVENSLATKWELTVPTRLYVCTEDQTVPPNNTLEKAKNGLTIPNEVTQAEEANLQKTENSIVTAAGTHARCPLYGIPVDWFLKF